MNQRQDHNNLLQNCGRAIAQAVSRRFPTAVAQVRSCGNCDEKSGTVAGFL
jgi:hypothetical protein